MGNGDVLSPWIAFLHAVAYSGCCREQQKRHDIHKAQDMEFRDQCLTNVAFSYIDPRNNANDTKSFAKISWYNA